jgi:hypothetical protein
MIGSRTYYARKLLTTLALVELAEEKGFWGSELIDSVDFHFSTLLTALSYDNIRSYVGLNESSDWRLEGLIENHAKDVFEWICGNRRTIKDSRELERLNAVIANPKALTKLKDGLPLEIAAEYTDAALVDFRFILYEVLARLSEADRLLTHIPEFYDVDFENAENISRLAKKIALYLKDNANATL